MTAPSTFLAETHERFLKAIVARLPLERIIELHLFPSIKQGGTESGVAVVAAVPAGERAVPAVGSALPVSGSAGPATSDEASPADPAPAADAPRAELPLEALVSDDSLPAPLQQPYEAAELAARAEPFDFQAREEIAADTAEASAGIEEEDVERLEEAVEAIEDSLVDSAAQAMAVASLEIADLPAAETRPRRYTIYAARYRLVLKGPDRGKWEVAITPEADAPLVTVESVVRGVQRRSGDEDEVGRWTGEELRVALRMGAT